MRRLAVWAGIVVLLFWAVAATFLLCFRPDVSLALNNRIFQRETMQGPIFLTKDDGPEMFEAFGNETSVFCGRPCAVEEISTDGQPNIYLCRSQWEGRKHLCTARFWPTRPYLVYAHPK